MRAIAALSLSVAAVAALRDNHHLSRAHTHVAKLHARNTTYSLKDMYKGESFLNDWSFFTEADPTQGLVNFQSKSDAQAKKLAYVQDDGTTVLAVDDTTQLKSGEKRDSIRITSKKTYNSGLFIADFWSMPHGCSVWPAYWSVGPNWPSAGEIDILEGVHEQDHNQITLHSATGSSCALDANSSKFSGTITHQTCASSDGDNSGCGVSTNDPRSYGHGFNLAAGGVYAHLWTSSGIKAWFFSRDEIPADITSQQPNPDSWGTPIGFWGSDDCDIASHFFDHALVIDTTLCGSFAGPTYQGAGCPGTCEDRVADPANFKYAKWNINYIAVYDS